MRIALISAWEEGQDEAALALLPLAGRSIVRRQLDLAVALGCERIACLASTPSPEIVRLQQAAERAGARFNAITGVRPLLGLTKAVDEVLVLAPRLLADPAIVSEALGNRPGMLVIPAEKGVAAGFERIDRENAWAGVMVLHGSAIERLAELPPDSDPISSLVRIAAQTGTRRILLAPGVLDSGEINLIGDAEAHARAERRWLQRSAEGGGWRRPASALAGLLVRALAPRLLAKRRAITGFEVGGGLLAAGAGVLAWFERPVISFAVLALSAASYTAARILRAIESGAARNQGGKWGEIVLDTVFIGAVVAASPRSPEAAFFAALVAVLAARLAEIHGVRAPNATFSDRILLFAIAAAASAFGKIVPIIQIFAVIALALELHLRRKSRLTQT